MSRTLLLPVCAMIISVSSLTGPASAASQALAADSPPNSREQTNDYHSHARAIVAEVLADPEFGGGASAPSLWQRFAKWIERLLTRMGHAISGLPPWLFWFVLIWLVLALLAILAHLIYVLLGVFGARSGSAAGARSEGAEDNGDLLGIRDLEPETAYAEASRWLSRSDWPRATRYLYMAAILRLDRAGRIRFRHAKTNQDYVRELSQDARRRTWFQQLTSVFEAVVYGSRPATEATCREMNTAVEALGHEDAIAKH